MVKGQAVIIRHNILTEDIRDMVVHFPEAARLAQPGQFLSVYCDDSSRLLPRPISICEIDREEGTLRMVYRIVGGGTEEFSRKKVGDKLEVMGPLGHGFQMKEGRAFLIGGGIGIPPVLELARQLKGPKTIILGYRDRLFLKEEFEPYGKVYVATEDGSAGTKGTVLDAILENELEGDILYACGPVPMLKALAEYAEKKGMEAQISLEERMACGIGACLGCVCRSKEVDHHTNVRNKRVCKDGPVFDAREVEFI